MKHLKVLIIEDSEDDVFILLRHLKNAGYDVEYQRAESAAEMLAALKEGGWDIILSDFSMPHFDGIAALNLLKQSGLDIPFIMISGTIGEDTAVRAMLAGADDYFIKGSLNRLGPAIERELKEAENRGARRRAEGELEESKKRLQLAIDATGAGVWEWDLLTDSLYWSPECRRIFQAEAFDNSLADFKKYVHPEDLAAVLRQTSEAVKQRRTFAVEYRFINGVGETRWAAAYGKAEYAPDGTALKIIGTVQDITDRKSSEEKLRKSEEHLNSLMRSVEGIVWEADADTFQFVFVSEPAERLLGYPLSKWLEPDFWKNHVHPEDRREAVEYCLKCTAENRDHEFEYRMMAADGRIVWLRDIVTVVAEKDRPTKLRGIMIDITERKQSEEKLRASEENFRALIQASTQFVWTADAGGTSDELFRWFSELSGRPVESVSDVIELMHPDDLETTRAAWLEALEKQTLFSQICRFLTRENEYCYLATRSIPMFNADGSFRQWVGTFNDITERMHAEEALRQNEFQLRLITDTVPALICYVDAEERLRFANKGVLEWFRMSMDEIVGMPVRELLGEMMYDSISGEIKKVFAGEKLSFERSVLRPNDSPRFVRLNYVPDFDPAGRVRGFFGFLIDLTENKQAEERLRKSEEQLRQAQKLESVGRLAGGIAHDFNNMLTAINGYSDLTLRRLDRESPLRHNIEEIKKAGERSAALTQQLLTFSRLQILQVKRIDINQVLSDSLVMIKRLIGEDIQVVSVLNPKLDLVEADPGQISQLILNLAVNARDAMPQGGTITIRTDNFYLDEDFVSRHDEAKPGDYVMLAVSDTGCGIDEETQQHVFEPFFTTKAVGKGTGLGLSTVYGIVKQSGGMIVLESEVDVGTTFEIYLPSVSKTDGAKEKQTQAPPSNEGSETILLVEDEQIVRNLSRQILQSCGYRVLEASDGVEALEVCAKNKDQIDLLITDVVMPQMSGHELAKKIVEIQPDIKILFTSGYTGEEIVHHGLSEGETNFIQKPFTFDKLAQKVRDVLD